MQKIFLLPVVLLVITTNFKSIAMDDTQSSILIEIPVGNWFNIDLMDDHHQMNGTICTPVHFLLEQQLGTSLSESQIENLGIDYEGIRKQLKSNESDETIKNMLHFSDFYQAKINQLTTIPLLLPMSDSMGLNIKGD